MKKLLSILLTLVMTVCLVNLNDSHIKAETETIVLGYHANTGYGVYSNFDCTSKYNGDYKDNITVVSSSEPVFKFSGLNTTSKDVQIWVNVNATIKIDGVNNIISSNNTTDLLSIQSGINCILKSNGGANDKLIVKSNGNTGLICVAGQLTLENGDYEVTTTGGGGRCIEVDSHGTLVIADATLKCEHSGTNAVNQVQIKNVEGLKFTGTGNMLATNKNNNDNSAIIYYNVNAADALKDVEIVTSEYTEGSNPDKGVLKYETDGMIYYTIFHVGSETGPKAKYIKLSKKQTPAPSPDPDPTYESCEKVIGPTWHWNNDKGVCEEYATVGTSTR